LWAHVTSLHTTQHLEVCHKQHLIRIANKTNTSATESITNEIENDFNGFLEGIAQTN
jgi:hypothetical protein